MPANSEFRKLTLIVPLTSGEVKFELEADSAAVFELGRTVVDTVITWCKKYDYKPVETTHAS